MTLTMSRSPITRFASLLGILLAVTNSSFAELPNIILCMSDDQGWEEVGYNGHPYLKTPALDEMARTGLRLDRFYSASSNCGPTRGSCMTVFALDGRMD